MADRKTAKQFIDIEDGKYYAIVLGLRAVDSLDLNEVGTMTIRLGQTEKELTQLIRTGFGFRYVLMQAQVNTDDDKYIELVAGETLVNAFFSIGLTTQTPISVRECSDTNLITNGTFTGSATGWTLGTNWSYNDNDIMRVNQTGTATQAVSATTGNDYAISFDMNCPTAASESELINVSFGNHSFTPSLLAPEVTYIRENIGSNHTLSIGSLVNSTAPLTVDNVSIREVTGSNLIDENDWDLGEGWERAGNAGVGTDWANESSFYQLVSGLSDASTYRVAFTIDGFFSDDEVWVGVGDFDGDNTTTVAVSAGHTYVDHVAVIADPEDAYIFFMFPSGWYRKITNVSLKLKTGSTYGPELVTNGSFSNSGSGWTFEGFTTKFGGPGYLLYKPNLSTLPEYAPSVITAVAKVQQNMPFPNFVIAGQGGSGENDYALFKKSTTNDFALWRSPVYQIGKKFDVQSIVFNLASAIDANTEIVPVLYFDDELTSSAGATINSTNYSSKLIKITSKNFDNSVSGESNFFLELQFHGSSLSTVNLPITINLDVKET